MDVSGGLPYSFLVHLLSFPGQSSRKVREKSGLGQIISNYFLQF
jgi:hypothetical protein